MHERVEEEQQRRGHQTDAGRVEPRGMLVAGLGNERPGGGQREETNGEVDQENRAPPEPEEVGLDEQPSEQGSAHRGDADEGAVHPYAFGRSSAGKAA